MNIEIRDIITLSDNNRYIVCSKIKLEDKNFYYLAEQKNVRNIKICVERYNNGRYSVNEIIDKDVINKLLPLFMEASMPVILESIKQENN